jgi:hypothetical protein
MASVIHIILGHWSMPHLIESHNFKYFNLFIHEKDQFWPKADMDQQEHFIIKPNKSVVLSFKPKLELKLMNDEYKCVDEEAYSLTKCIVHFIIHKVGCSLNFFKHHGHPNCSSKDVLKTQQILEWIQISSFKNLTSTTGCFLKCKKTKYEMSILSDEKILWSTEWISEVFIQPIEYLSYDLGGIIGDLGGHLGLFLGWSLLSITLYIGTLLRKIGSNIKF